MKKILLVFVALMAFGFIGCGDGAGGGGSGGAGGSLIIPTELVGQWKYGTNEAYLTFFITGLGVYDDTSEEYFFDIVSRNNNEYSITENMATSGHVEDQTLTIVYNGSNTITVTCSGASTPLFTGTKDFTK